MPYYPEIKLEKIKVRFEYKQWAEDTLNDLRQLIEIDYLSQTTCSLLEKLIKEFEVSLAPHSTNIIWDKEY